MLPLVKCISCRVSDSYNGVNIDHQKLAFWTKSLK